MKYHTYDAVVVGAGGAGLRAAIELTDVASVAVVTKLYPTRSHTGAAQGGVCAALGNTEEDHWEWHMFDTVKGGDYLVDQDAAEVMCREAIDEIYELEHMGLPFNRTPEGLIDQRRFGGHTRNFGEGPVRRACYAADRTGHMILQTMYQQSVKHDVHFYNEFHVFDLILSEDGRAAGVVAYELATGEIHIFHAKAVLFATGGFGRAFRVTSNAQTLTGDGMAVVYRRGIPLEDMEFYQFHPTGMYKMGILLSEAARGEGAILRNGLGERFMERYAPTLLDLAPRDMVTRAIYQEIREGRGAEGKDYVYLDLRHLGKQVIDEKLPDITDFVRTYFHIDPAKDLVPIQPTAHYAMGGIPTDIDGRVVTDEKNTPLPGLYAAGETACVSVHGANRLGTNSLLDILVFGRRAGAHMAKFVKENDLPPLPKDAGERVQQMLDGLLKANGHESVAKIRTDLQRDMMDLAGVYRTAEGLTKMQGILGELRERYQHIGLQDRGSLFNAELVDAVELGFLLDCSEALVSSALAREESRGGHYREDFPKRDDQRFLSHTLAYKRDNGQIELRYKPVVITRFQPKERKY